MPVMVIIFVGGAVIDRLTLFLWITHLSVITSPPEGVSRYCFQPVCLSLSVWLYVCLSVCLSVRLSVCPANILVFYFSAIRRDIDLKFIQDTYSVVLNSIKTY